MLVVGVGQCCWDILGEIDHYPAPDSKEELLLWEEEGGGPVATALVAAKRLGVSARFFGVVGDDPEGEKVRLSLMAEGIDISGLATRNGALTQKAFIVVEKAGGERTIFWKRPTGLPLQPAELPGDFLDGASLLLLDGLMTEISFHAARLARTRGVPVMLDAGRVRPGMLDIVPFCNYLVAAEQFALDLGWDGETERFREIAMGLGPPVVTVTLGASGSITWRRGELFRTPAFPVEAVDTTGAGDVFHGAYAYGILQGWGLPRVIEFASAAAALKCRSFGGRTGIHGLSEVLEFLQIRRNVS